MKMKKVFALTLAAVLLAGLWGCKNQEQPGQTEPNPQVTEPGSSVTDPDATTPLVPLDPSEPTNGVILTPTQEVSLGSDLLLTDMGSYTGIYMEDGVDDFVENIFMVVLKNNNAQDLQLARLELVNESSTAVFEATNIPAGQSVVLLEKNRMTYEVQKNTSFNITNLAFFSEPMGLKEDRIKITEGGGTLTVKNLTDTVMNEILIYYKNSASDIYYGGITYRTRLTDGLNPGESKTLVAAHFYPGASTVVDVQIP